MHESFTSMRTRTEWTSPMKMSMPVNSRPDSSRIGVGIRRAAGRSAKNVGGVG